MPGKLGSPKSDWPRFSLGAEVRSQVLGSRVVFLDPALVVSSWLSAVTYAAETVVVFPARVGVPGNMRSPVPARSRRAWYCGG